MKKIRDFNVVYLATGSETHRAILAFQE